MIIDHFHSCVSVNKTQRRLNSEKNISLSLVIFQFVSQKYGLFEQSVWHLATSGRQKS